MIRCGDLVLYWNHLELGSQVFLVAPHNRTAQIEWIRRKGGFYGCQLHHGLPSTGYRQGMKVECKELKSPLVSSI